MSWPSRRVDIRDAKTAPVTRTVTVKARPKRTRRYSSASSGMEYKGKSISGIDTDRQDNLQVSSVHRGNLESFGPDVVLFLPIDPSRMT